MEDERAQRYVEKGEQEKTADKTKADEHPHKKLRILQDSQSFVLGPGDKVADATKTDVYPHKKLRILQDSQSFVLGPEDKAADASKTDEDPHKKLRILQDSQSIDLLARDKAERERWGDLQREYWKAYNELYTQLTRKRKHLLELHKPFLDVEVGEAIAKREEVYLREEAAYLIEVNEMKIERMKKEQKLNEDLTNDMRAELHKFHREFAQAERMLAQAQKER